MESVILFSSFVARDVNDKGDDGNRDDDADLIDVVVDDDARLFNM